MSYLSKASLTSESRLGHALEDRNTGLISGVLGSVSTCIATQSDEMCKGPPGFLGDGLC